MRVIKTISVVLSLVTLLVTSVLAEEITKPRLAANPTSIKSNVGLSLVDPSRLHIRQGYTLSYSSFGGRGLMTGMYQIGLTYEIARPLSITANIGYLHQPQNLFMRGRTNSINGKFLTDFRLDFRPSENFFLRIDISSFPSAYYFNSFDRWDWRQR